MDQSARYQGKNATIEVFTAEGYPAKVALNLPGIIPEFPSFLILPLFMVVTLLAVTVYRRKHTNVRRNESNKRTPVGSCDCTERVISSIQTRARLSTSLRLLIIGIVMVGLLFV